MELRSNEDLARLLGVIGSRLRARGRDESAAGLEEAGRWICGSPTEFLRKAEEVLRSALETEASFLEGGDQASMTHAIEQIDRAFRRIGGA